MTSIAGIELKAAPIGKVDFKRVANQQESSVSTVRATCEVVVRAPGKAGLADTGWQQRIITSTVKYM